MKSAIKVSIIVFVSSLLITGCQIKWPFWTTRANKIEVKPGEAATLDVAITDVSAENQPAEMTQEKIIPASQATLKTNLGDIVIKFYPEETPLTVENFTKLARQNFYDNTRFHRIIKNFMIQGGDPFSKEDDKIKWGTGGPGYTFPDEITDRKLVRGVVAMANSGSNTNGSQFFIVTAESTPWLDGKHTVFGEVISGLEVVDKIGNLATDTQDHPLEDAVIQSIELVIPEPEPVATDASQTTSAAEAISTGLTQTDDIQATEAPTTTK